MASTLYIDVYLPATFWNSYTNIVADKNPFTFFYNCNGDTSAANGNVIEDGTTFTYVPDPGSVKFYPQDNDVTWADYLFQVNSFSIDFTYTGSQTIENISIPLKLNMTVTSEIDVSYNKSSYVLNPLNFSIDTPVNIAGCTPNSNSSSIYFQESSGLNNTKSGDFMDATILLPVDSQSQSNYLTCVNAYFSYLFPASLSDTDPPKIIFNLPFKLEFQVSKVFINDASA